MSRFARKSVLHDVAPCCVFGQNHMRAPCFRPVFMYMSKVSCTWARSGTDARFARKSVLHDVAPRSVFWPKSHARTMFSPSFHVHEQGRVPMPVLPESRDRAFFLDLGIWYLFISHHSHMTIQHETQTLLHDCISQDRAFFHDFPAFATCSIAIIGVSTFHSFMT